MSDEWVWNSGTLFINAYTYHHGYYDHAEREFRGFGRVEQTDTEDFISFRLSGANNVTEEDLHQPPVKTITFIACYKSSDRG